MEASIKEAMWEKLTARVKAKLLIHKELPYGRVEMKRGKSKGIYLVVMHRKAVA